MAKVYGTNTVFEALNLNRVRKVYLLEGYSNEKMLKLINSKNLPVVYLRRNELDLMVKGNHQGIVASVKNLEPVSLESLIKKADGVELPVLIILDGLKDPHNLGSILRSADIFSAQGVIYKKKNSVSLDETVEKISTGAANYVPCCEVTNLTNTIKELKRNGYWVVGFEGEATQELTDIPKDVKLAIVIGSEGEGISRLVKENCDILLKIPMAGHGHINSLNASVACSIALYEIRRNCLNGDGK